MSVERIPLADCSHVVRCALGSQNVRIWSTEHGSYWRPDAAGYTRDLGDAGVYTLGDAWRRTSHCGPEKGIEFVIMPTRTVEFLVANKESPVVSGRAIEPDPRKPSRGASYTLADGRTFRLNLAEVRAMGMPRWDI